MHWLSVDSRNTELVRHRAGTFVGGCGSNHDARDRQGSKGLCGTAVSASVVHKIRGHTAQHLAPGKFWDSATASKQISRACEAHAKKSTFGLGCTAQGFGAARQFTIGQDSRPSKSRFTRGRVFRASPPWDNKEVAQAANLMPLVAITCAYAQLTVIWTNPPYFGRTYPQAHGSTRPRGPRNHDGRPCGRAQRR